MSYQVINEQMREQGKPGHVIGEYTTRSGAQQHVMDLEHAQNSAAEIMEAEGQSYVRNTWVVEQA